MYSYLTYVKCFLNLIGVSPFCRKFVFKLLHDKKEKRRLKVIKDMFVPMKVFILTTRRRKSYRATKGRELWVLMKQQCWNATERSSFIIYIVLLLWRLKYTCWIYNACWLHLRNTLSSQNTKMTLINVSICIYVSFDMI